MTPGYLGTYNWRSTLLGLFLFLTTNIITTQHIAAHFDYQPALGDTVRKRCGSGDPDTSGMGRKRVDL